jgi:hypothetical protein
LVCFRRLLGGFAEQEGSAGRPVYGVYVGWRGLSVRAPVVKELTFWSRKETAHRVGSGDVVEFLATLEALHRQEREESPILGSRRSDTASAARQSSRRCQAR